ncbi:MAG: hypothetical protein Q9183_004109, partial [Haloplaca sp. 2 TL-2023]
MLRLSKGIDPLPQPKDGFDVHSALVDLVRYVADTTTVGPTFRHALEEVDAGLQQYGNSLLGNHGGLELIPVHQEADEEMQDVDDNPQATRFEELTSQIPTRTAFEVSLLSHSDSYIFKSLSDAFLSACQSPKNLHSFSELPVLRKSLAMTEPLYVSFFVRIWCGDYSISARAAAITTLSNYFKGERLVADVQVLLPYIIHALGDASPMIRRAATELLVILADAYRAMVDNTDGGPVALPVLGKGQIYGRESDEQDKLWLNQEITVKLIREWLVPHVEEFRLGPDQIGRCLIDHIEAGTEGTVLGKRTSKFKTSFRSTVLSWLCSHVVNTPLYSARDRLLPLLTSIAKVGHTSTVSLLAPLLKATLAQGSITTKEKCEKEHIDTLQYVDHVMEIARPNDRETVKLLEDYMIDPTATIHGTLYLAIFRRLRTLWPQLPAQHQVSLARAMLDLALLDPDSKDTKVQQQEAADALRDAKMSCETLNVLLQDRPSLVKNASERAPKRRRTTAIVHTRGDEIRRTSIILEAIESSVSKGHLPLLSGLFEVVTDLQSYKESTGTELHYLELMAMGSILTILESSPNAQIQKADVRADVLVDCIRSSSNVQVQQTALLLVSVLAGITPELILHNVMPIFTFMGSSIMQRTDDYSTHVVQKTMDSVIPRVMESLRERNKDPLAGVSELLLSFVAAFEHVPSQRRLALFRSLMDLVGPGEYLFALVILLQNKLPDNKRIVQFSADLLDCYQVNVLFETVERFAATVLDSTQTKPTFSSHLVSSPHQNSKDGGTSMMAYLAALLGDKRLLSKCKGAFTSEKSHVAGLRSTLARIMDQLLSLSRQSRNMPRNQFGKKDITAVMNATHTVVGNYCLGADSEEMQTTSLLSLSTIVEVSRDEFLPLIPQTLPKALSLFNSAIEADQCSNRLHRAAYSFFSAVLLYIPWTVTGHDLEFLLRVSHGSANTSMNDEWSTERGEALDLVAKQVESKDCCGALERTWSNAMEEGPE